MMVLGRGALSTALWRAARAFDYGGLDPRDLKTALFCMSSLRKGEVLAYVGRIENLDDLRNPAVRRGRSPLLLPTHARWRLTTLQEAVLIPPPCRHQSATSFSARYNI